MRMSNHSSQYLYTDEISFPLDQPRVSPAVPEQPHSPVTSMDQQILTPLLADEHMLSPVTQTLDSLVPTNLHEDVGSNCKEHSDSQGIGIEDKMRNDSIQIKITNASIQFQ